MKIPDYNSPTELKLFMERKGMAMQKKFGQNFLVNANARRFLIDELEIDESSVVWEVGPGLGAMTDEMLSRGASVVAFEIDRGFAECLSNFFASYEQMNKFRLVQGDVLRTWRSHLEKEGQPDRFFGNLPYNIAATIIADTISDGLRFERAVVTVQKEVAQRMCAKPGEDEYSSFSVLCAWAYDIKPVMDLAGGSFWPRPNVDSRAVVMRRKESFPCCQNPIHFQKILRALFASRRKTVKNNLSAFYSNSERAACVLEKAKINPMIRAEELSLQQILCLSDASSAIK